MAGEPWIKMRTALDTDPRVFAVASATKAHPQHVVGALHWLWSQADRYTVNGKLWGYSPEQVDAKVGIQGFCSALAGLKRNGKPRPWLEVGDGYVAVLYFSEHNGESAKKRGEAALRASRSRHTKSARNAHLERERESETEPENQDTPSPRAGEAKSPGGCERGPKLPDTLAVTPQFVEAWADYERHRKALGLNPMSGPAVLSWWRKMAEWGVDRAVAALRFTVERNARNIIEPETSHGHANGQAGAGSHSQRAGPASGLERGIAAQRERDARAGGTKPELPLA